MRILLVCSEAYPLMKTGGLGDVCASLPQALRIRGMDARIILPGYPSAFAKAEDVSWTPDTGKTPWRIASGRLPGTGVPVYLLDWPEYFSRPGNPYRTPEGQDWPDNALRFAAFARAVIEWATATDPNTWKPDLLHLNDWQTGLIGPLMHDHPRRPPILFTLHNLAYQGLFPGFTRFQLGLPASHWSPEKIEFHGQLSFLKAGLVYADAITTVSPTYAREIQMAPLGMGLEGLLHARNRNLQGILIGIDYQEWNPKTDHHLVATYSAEDLSGKQQNKLALQQELGLPQRPHLPLLGFVGRMVEQKGIDLLLEACTPLVAENKVQLALIGTGQAEYEAAATALAKTYPESCCTRITYDEGLAHRIEAGADLFLMPSRFEPCGLNQMYSLRYGTPPIVHSTGGLADTVIDTNPQTLEDGTATGFRFESATVKALSDTLQRALGLYLAPQKSHWRQLQQTGMRSDFSWNRSAQQYCDLYQSLLQSRQPMTPTQ